MFKNNTVLQKFYLIALSLGVITLSVGIWHYWYNGSANIDNISKVFDASIKLQEIKKKNSISSIKRLVETDQVRKAIENLEKVEKSTKELSFLSGWNADEYSALKESTSELKNVFNKMIAYPKLSKILNVLGAKVTSFEQYVVGQRWRTLTRISRRLKANIENKSSATLSTSGRYGQYTIEKLQSLISVLNRDIKLMTSVTNKSFLSTAEKLSINTKIKGLETEIAMFEKYVGEFKSFSKPMDELIKTYNAWLVTIEPKITYKMIEFERDSKKILFSLLGLLGFLLLTLGVGIFIASRVKDFEKKHVEDVILDSIKDGLIAKENSLDHHFSKKFDIELNKYREYIHKRMSFGAVFRDALPFSTLMLDSNLHTAWGNQNFYELFGFTNLRDKNAPLTWDFINKFTNLGENDPILLALNENIAGIYQVQVKTQRKDHENGESCPYEMYVSPVEYNGQTRIVIFFYPLDSLEQTLKDQMISVVGPVTRAIEALKEDQFDFNFQDDIQNDFRIAGIENVFESFVSYNERVQNQIDAFENDIHRFESESHDNHKLINDLNETVLKQMELMRMVKMYFSEAKKNIVSLVENRSDIELVIDQEKKKAREIIAHDKELIQSYRGMFEKAEKFNTSLSNVSQIRSELRATKDQIERFKTNLVQVVDQALIIQKVNNLDDRIAEVLTRIKIEMKSVDSLFRNLSESNTRFDVLMSKLELVFENSYSGDVTKYDSVLNDLCSKYEVLAKESEGLFNFGRKHDEETVNSVKNLFESFVKCDQQLEKTKELISGQIRYSKSTHDLTTQNYS